MSYTEEELYEMSDEDLQKAFREVRAELASPEIDGTVGDDLEQPDEDSDYETSSDDEEEIEVDEGSETTESEPDEETEEVGEEEAEETKEEPKKNEQPVRRKYRANGKDFEFTDQEIFEQFGQVFGQAMNYTQKMQQIKPWRKTIDAIEEAKLTHEDVALAIDVLNGDKNAIAALLKRTGVDALEIDTENNSYIPKDYGRNDTELAISEIVDQIKGDQEYAITYDVLERQWDTKSRMAFVENPELIRQLHIDVKSGMFDTISPIANKLKVYDGGRNSDLEYYKIAAQQYFSNQAQEEARLNARNEEQAVRSKVAEVKAAQQQRAATKTASIKRKAAVPTQKSSGVKQVDYLDASDEDFEEWYKKLESSY